MRAKQVKLDLVGSHSARFTLPLKSPCYPIVDPMYPIMAGSFECIIKLNITVIQRLSETTHSSPIPYLVGSMTRNSTFSTIQTAWER